MRPRIQWLVTAILGILAALSVVAAVLVAVSHEDPVLTALRGEPATTSAEPEEGDLPRIGTQNLLTQGPPVPRRGATCLWRAGADYLMFNAGRYNVWLSVDRESQPTPEALISNLIPIAEKIEGELR